MVTFIHRGVFRLCALKRRSLCHDDIRENSHFPQFICNECAGFSFALLHIELLTGIRVRGRDLFRDKRHFTEHFI